MVIGQTLVVIDGAQTYYSPWFSRGGDTAEFTADVISNINCSMSIYVETKNSEDPDSGASSAGAETIAAGSTGRTTWAPSGGTWPGGAEELVRFRYEISNDQSGTAVIHFRMLSPSWVTN